MMKQVEAMMHEAKPTGQDSSKLRTPLQDEFKPVTNSRDTQEIMYRKGLEILKIFKNYTLKTFLLDDFMYYENRQKVMQEEKAKFLSKRKLNYENL